MTRLTRMMRHAACCVALNGILAIAARAQVASTPPTAAKPDCQKMMAGMDHAAMGQMDHAAMGQMDHAAMMKDCPMAMPAGGKMAMDGKMAMGPTMPGQAAFGAISEIVRLLERDPATDWSKVNIEALRQHFIDMDEVTLRSRIVQRNVNGGIVAEITGPPMTAAAIRRMVPNHAKMFESSTDFDAKVALLPAGVRLTLLARNPGDAGLVARVRGLGAIGFLTEGDHHAAHHLAIARGEAMAHMH